MNWHKQFIGLAILLSTAVGFAQNEEDALRLSTIYFGGTARNMGTAGALTAMGADFSNATKNPAGLGRLSKSNVSVTTNIEIPSTVANFNGTEDNANRAAFNFSNISYVKAYQLDPGKFKGFYSLQMGLGINRIKSFNDEIAYTGQSDSSILHSFINEATGTPHAFIFSDHPFTAGLAYDVFAIDPGVADGEYTTQFQNGPATHNRQLSRQGGITEINLLTLSANYANKLLLGGSVNIMWSNYNEMYSHQETYVDSLNWLNEIDYTGRLNIKGRGVNLRAGLIYMPMEQLRLGLGIETPTHYWMNDFWTNNMDSGTDDGPKFVESEFVPTGSYKYRITTPFRANFSAAYVLKKFGSIGAQFEYVDYSMSKLNDRNNSSAPYSFAAENTQINNIYKPTFNLNIGLEARITKRWYARGGFAMYGSPYTEESGNVQASTNFYTAGFGYNFGKFYLDAAYVLQTRKEDYYAYDPTIPGSYASLDVKNSQIVFSGGFRF